MYIVGRILAEHTAFQLISTDKSFSVNSFSRLDTNLIDSGKAAETLGKLIEVSNRPDPAEVSE